LSAHRDEIAALEDDASARDFRGGLENLQDGARERALAAAGLAREREDLTRRDRERDVVHGAHAAVTEHVVDREPVELEQGLRRDQPHVARLRPKTMPASAARWLFCLRSRGLLTSSMPARISTSATTVRA